MANVSSSNGLEKRPKLRFPGFDEPWEICKAESLFRNITDKNHPDDTVLTIVQGKGTLPRDKSGRNIHYDDASLSNYKRVEKGDFIIHLRSFEGGLEMAHETGIVSPAYTILRCSKPHSSLFYEAYFHTDEFINHVLSKAVEGIRDGRQISYEAFKWLGIPYCANAEQEKISALFEAINRRIEKQEQIVNALKKYKRGLLRTVFSEKCNHSLLHDAVNHKIDEVCDVLSGKRIPKGETFSPNPTAYRYITVSDMGEKYVRLDTVQYITSHTEKQISRYKVRNGDIIISVAGTLGKLNIITPDLDGVNLTENCDRFTNFRGIIPEYLYQVLSSDLIQSQIEASKTKNGQPKLALERIRNFVIPVPRQVRQAQFVGVMNSIDKYIASQQAILDRCCKVRVGLLQQLFI